MSDNALKNDQEKPRMELVPAGATLEIAKVLTFGAKKYAPHNWRKGFDYSRLIGALERHIAAFKEGEDTDPESGLPHMAHAGCCVMFLLEHQLKGYGKDDRYIEKKKIIEEPIDKYAFLPKYLFIDMKSGVVLKYDDSNIFTKFHDIANNVFYLIPSGMKLEDFYYDPSWGRHYGPGLYSGVPGRGSIVEVFATWRRDS